MVVLQNGCAVPREKLRPDLSRLSLKFYTHRPVEVGLGQEGVEGPAMQCNGPMWNGSEFFRVVFQAQSCGFRLRVVVRLRVARETQSAFAMHGSPLIKNTTTFRML